MRAAASGLRVADAMITRFHTFLSDLPLQQALQEAQRDMQPVYPVTDPDLRVTGMVLRNELLQAKVDSEALVGSIARTVPAVRAEAPFEEAFSLMQQSGSPVLPVVNSSAQIVGLVSLNLLSERSRARG